MLEKIKRQIKGKIQRLLETGAIHVVAGSFLTKFVAFFGSIFVVRFLSKQDYGILSYYENILGYFLIFSGFGMASGLQRYLVLQDEMPDKKGLLFYAMKKGFLVNAFLFLAAVGYSLFFPHKAEFAGHRLLMIPLALCVPFVFSQEAVLSSLRALFDYKRYAVLSFSISTAVILSRILGALLGGVYAISWLKLAADSLTAFVCVLLFLRAFFRGVEPRRQKKDFLREMNVYSFQVMLTNGLWTIFMLNDIQILGQMTGEGSIVADYRVAYVLPANLSILTAAIATFVGPYFTKHENEKDYDWIREKFKLVLKLTSVIVGVMALACFVLAKPLIWLLYGEEYFSAIPCMRVLLIASFFNNGIRASVANILSSMGAQKANLAVAAVGIVVQVTLDLLLIPRFGAMGVAISSVVVYTVMSSCLLVYFVRHYLRKGANA